MVMLSSITSCGFSRLVMIFQICLFCLDSSTFGQLQLHINSSPSELPRESLYEKKPLRHPARIKPPTPASIPSNPPETWIAANFSPAPAPQPSPNYHGSIANSPVSNHRRARHAVSPSSPQGQDCNGIYCSDPLTLSPFGSPCACVYPIQVVIDLGVAPFWLFTRIRELEVEVASGTFLKQSQVKIMGANASSGDQERTRVTIYLVPLGEKFDNVTALLIFDRFWQKRIPIDVSIFGDYEVIYVHYPGLPSCPPSASGGSLACPPGETGSQQHPVSVDVHTGKSQKTDPKIIILLVFTTFTLIFVFAGVIFIILKRRHLVRTLTAPAPVTIPSNTNRPGTRPVASSSLASSTSVSLVSPMITCPPSVKAFSRSELEKATDGFSSKKLLGEGGFGLVYHGITEDGSEVAVKLLKREDHHKEEEFIAEMEMLSRLHHRNLVKLVGICIEGYTRCLVYELVRNGSVESHLHGVDKKNRPLDWDARMKIALGAARGLAYLHEDSNPRVIHRDFKASNILLLEDFTPKISDFGLAREASQGSRHISTRVMGTFGYVAPEYAMTGHLDFKSDVYSYGVVLLELLTGRKPVFVSQDETPENLVTWARPLLTSSEGLSLLIDPALGQNCDFDNVAKAAAIALMCVHPEASERPFMGEVVQALKLICNDTDTQGESYSEIESASCKESEYDDGESRWWIRSTPRHSSLSIENCSEDLRRPHSTNSLIGRVASSSPRLGSSGPLRTVKQRSAFYRLRGSVSGMGVTRGVSV